MKKNKVLLKNMSLVSLGIMFSRILGYFRDMLVATTFGAGFYADAFYAAFRIPNFFRRLFGENSLNAAFVPIVNEFLETKGKDETEKLISAVFTVMFVLLGILTIFGILLAFPITKVITWGFEKNKLLLTSKLLQIMFPYMWLICLAALGLSVLTCLKIFFIPAASSASLSISEILYILLIVNYLSEKYKIFGLAVSVVVGGILQLFINMYLIKSKKYKIRLDLKNFVKYFSWEPIKKIYTLFTPIVIGFSIDQINSLVDQLCASFLKEGSITALYYSNRLMQLPLALFAISLATVALPQLSSEAILNNYEEMKKTILHSIRNIVYFVLPASLGLLILGKYIIITLFEYGKFNREATIMTFSCLAFYSLGLLFFSISKIFVSSFYALKQPKLPVRIAMICMCLNIVLNIILMQFLYVGGLALATSISSFCSCCLLYLNLKKFIPLKLFDTETKKFLIKILLTSTLFSIYLYTVTKIFNNAIVITVYGVISGTILYIILTKILKIEETKILFSFINKFIPLFSD